MYGIHHVSVGINDLKRARAFYDPLLPIVGLQLRQADEESADYGTDRVLFSLETPTNGAAASAGNGVHIAFEAKDRAMVQEFHRTALRLGGVDAGAPGPRAKYGPHYYGAFVLDPEGNKIEAVYDPV